jgi:hypothetical protein
MHFLRYGITIIAVASTVAQGLGAEPLEQYAEKVNQQIWSRFISPQGVMYDYAGLGGEVILPTPEECEKSMPNALGWWTPIENGGFFNGMYLIAQCERYQHNKTSENREKVKTLVRGLYILQDVANTPGVIARGTGSDGKCHYVASSNDQCFPWFMGLSAYLETDIPSDAERKECIARMERQANALKQNNWMIIGERPGFERGWWLSGQYSSCVHVAMVSSILMKYSTNPYWKKFHYQLLRGKTSNGLDRRQIIMEGPKNMARWSAWYLANCQYAVRKLYDAETDPALKEVYRKSLQNTAQKALPLIDSFRKFNADAPRPPFTPDWRLMTPPFRKQQNGNESEKLAMEQIKVWHKHSPAINEEKVSLKPSFAAAWIVALCGQSPMLTAIMPQIEEMLALPDYGKLYYATFFYVENLVNTLRFPPKPLTETIKSTSKSDTKFIWDVGKFGKIAGNTLTVTVPEQSKLGQNSAKAKIDLVPLRGQTLSFSIMAKGCDISEPPQDWNGVKFMLNYHPAGGTERWHHPSRIWGSFDWKELSFVCGIDPAAESGTLLLGLQDSSGKVEFDLSSLKITSIFPVISSDYKIRYPESIRNRARGRGVMSPHSMTEDDFLTLKHWNVNLIRLQYTRNWGEADTDQDLDEYDRWLDEKLKHTDFILEQARKYGIKVVIDLHSPPGGRDKSMDMKMFYDEKFARHFIAVWEKIAKRYKGNPVVWGYDLVNEPVQTRPAKYDYWTLQKMAAQAVRAIDPETPIIIESNEWDSPNAFTYLPALEMDNVIYQVHMYVPGSFTHQAVGNSAGVKSGWVQTTYPGMISGANWDIEEIRRSLKPVRDFQKKHNAKIFVGEFSAIAWAPGAEKYLADCIQVFEEYQWDWTYHAFREWNGWSVEHEASQPGALKKAVKDTPRKRVLLKAFNENEPYFK